MANRKVNDDPAEDLSGPAETVARGFFGLGSGPQAVTRLVRQSLVGAVVAAILTPLVFYLRFGEVPSLGWGLTIFLVAYSLLSAVGIYFLRRREYHTPVALKGDWLDKVGSFWLMACAFGPLTGWFLSMLSLTESNWRWLYGLRVLLCVGLPVLTALPLTRYARGKSMRVAVPILLVVTLLPVLAGINPALDLLSGPVNRQVEIVAAGQAGCRSLDGQPLGFACQGERWGKPGEVVELAVLGHTRQALP